MSYLDAFVLAVPTDRKDAYIAHSKEAWDRIFAPAGALRMTETWGDDVPEGEVTSFPMAVKREPGETVVLGWIEWPDKRTRDACSAAMADGATTGMADMPFDGKRLIYGGFVPIVTAEREDAA